MQPRFHDPTIIPFEGQYLCFSTDMVIEQVQVSQSGDLLHWDILHSALETMPESVLSHTGTKRFWAPDVVCRDGQWRLYCCASQFGKTQSVIGMAVSDRPDRAFAYQGDVIKSMGDTGFNTPNAIDPCVLRDRAGEDYMIYGSFFGGIRLAKLNNEGFLKEAGEGILLAGGGHRAVEGAFAFYHKVMDQFVLLTSWGSLAHDYHIRVAYSKDIQGPYIDSQGFPMTDTDPVHVPGDKIAGGYNFDIEGFSGVMAPGHCSVMPFHEGLMLVHHARPEGDVKHPFMQLRRMFFTKQGKLLAWPLPYDGAEIAPAESLPQKLALIRLDRDNNGVTYGRHIGKETCCLRFSDEGVSMDVYGKHYEGVAGRQNGRFGCTLVSQDGECLWGVEKC